MFKYILLSIFSFSALATMDLHYGAQGRSYPGLGGEFYLETGYNQLLWGSDPGGEKKQPWYGLIRPSIRLSTSAVVNQAEAKIEVFPISFIGMAAGRRSLKSDYDFNFYNCDEVHCRGTMERNFVQGKMAIGFFGIIMMGQITTEQIEHSEDDKPFAEFKKGMIGAPGFDISTEQVALLGYKMQSGSMIGVLSNFTRFEHSEQTFQMNLGIYQFKSESSQYTIGLGTFESTHIPLGGIAVFKWQFDVVSTKKMI